MKRIASLGISFILVLLILSLGIQLKPAQAQQGGFFEPFEDPEMPGWDRSPGTEVVDGVLFIGSENNVHRPGEWSALELSIRARHMTSADFVVSFRVAAGEGYHLVLGMESIILQRESNGEVQLLESSAFPEIGVGEWFELILIALDENITVSIDQGDPLLVVTDVGPLNSGGLSIETVQGSEIQVDEISLDIPGQEIEQEENGEELSQTDSEDATVGDLPTEPWVYTGGPSGGLGYDIRMDPRDKEIMYVTDALAGAFKSTDGGIKWTPINNGITARIGPSADGIPVFSLTVDQNNPDTVWVGTQLGGGVFRSDDSGKTWLSMSNGIEERGLTIRGFTVEPGNSDTVYLAGEVPSWEWNNEEYPGILFDLTKGVVYKSTDRGENWNRIWYGDHLARYVLIHPDNFEKLYVSTGIFDREASNSNPETLEPGGVGVLRSFDGGLTWEELGVNRGFRSDELYVGSLAMHPTKPEILLAAASSDAHLTALGRMIGAIYRTIDGGDSWERVLDLPNASAVEFCESDPNIVYAGASSFFYRSDDGGLTWEITSGSEGRLDVFWGPDNVIAGFPIDMQCDPDNAMKIYVNNYGGGNFLSSDGGYTWKSVSSGYTGAIMSNIVASANNPVLVYGTARSGIFKSTDGGVTWVGLATGKARALEAQGLTINPLDDQHIIAVITDSGPFPKISLDGGQTWHESDPEIKNGDQADWADIKTIAFSTTEPGVVIGVQGEKKCNDIQGCENGMGALYSSDSGESWAQSDLPHRVATDLVFDQTGTAYVSLYPADIYRSENGGQTWTLVSGDVLSGQSLTNPDAVGQVINALTIAPDDNSKMYAGFALGGVSISSDGGVTWLSSSAGMIPESSVVDFVVDHAHPDVMYAATYNSGIYRSVDHGLTWQEINEGLTMRASVNMSLSTDGSFLYAATEGGGVFRLSPDGNPPLAETVETLDNQEDQQAEETETDQITEDIDQDIPPMIDEKNQPRDNFPYGWVLGGVVLLVLGGIAGFVLAKTRMEN